MKLWMKQLKRKNKMKDERTRKSRHLLNPVEIGEIVWLLHSGWTPSQIIACVHTTIKDIEHIAKERKILISTKEKVL